MKDLHHFDVHLTPTGLGCKILMDGKEINNVRSLQIEAGVDQLPVVTMQVIATMDMTGWLGSRFEVLDAEPRRPEESEA